MKNPPEWSAFRYNTNHTLSYFQHKTLYLQYCRSTDYGYTRLYVANSTHLRVQQVSAEQGGKVIDEIWLIQSNHGPFV